MADDNIQPEPPRGSAPRRGGDDIQGQKPRRRRDEDEDEEERRPRKRREEEDDYEDRVRRKDDGIATLIPYRNPNALISYYCGVFALIPCVGLILGPVALVLGFLGLSYNKKHPTAGGVAHAIVGIVLGSLVLLGHAAVIILAFAGAIFK